MLSFIKKYWNLCMLGFAGLMVSSTLQTYHRKTDTKYKDYCLIYSYLKLKLETWQDSLNCQFFFALNQQRCVTVPKEIRLHFTLELRALILLRNSLLLNLIHLVLSHKHQYLWGGLKLSLFTKMIKMEKSAGLKTGWN